MATRLEHRRPGSSISFLDGPTGEVILSLASDERGELAVSFHLYDSYGSLAAESGEVSTFPEGIKVFSEAGELLLDIPAKTGENIKYRLYNRKGELLTRSDGVSTRIGPCLRMESLPRGGGTHGYRPANLA